MGARERLTLSVVAAILVVAALWLIVVAPERSMASSLLAQINAEHQTLASGQAQLASERAARSSYPGEVHALEVLVDAIPASDQVPQLINLVNALERGHVINWSSTALASGSADGFTALNISFTFTASYTNLQNFIAALDALNKSNGSDLVTAGRLATVNSLQLGSGASGGESASVTMTVYEQPSQAATGASGAMTTAGAQG